MGEPPRGADVGGPPRPMEGAPAGGIPVGPEDGAMVSVRVEVDGVGLNVALAGPEGAPAVLLLHGFPLDHRMWESQVRALAPRWRVLAPDLRGLGASESGDGQYTMETYVDDLFAVLDHVGAHDVVGCGLSMGGYVLLRALQREPDRFRAAVLADTRSAADDDEGRLARAAAVRALKRKGAEWYAGQFARVVLGRTTLAKRPAVAERIEAIIAGNDPIGMAGAQIAMAARTDTTAVLSDLGLPVLVVVGEEDELTPRETAGATAEALPDGRLAVVRRAGHLSNLENPKEFDRALVRFLEEVAPPG